MLPYEWQLAFTGPRAISRNLVLNWLKNPIGEEEELPTLAATTSSLPGNLAHPKHGIPANQYPRSLQRQPPDNGVETSGNYAHPTKPGHATQQGLLRQNQVQQHHA